MPFTNLLGTPLKLKHLCEHVEALGYFPRVSLIGLVYIFCLLGDLGVDSFGGLTANFFQMFLLLKKLVDLVRFPLD